MPQSHDRGAHGGRAEAAEHQVEQRYRLLVERASDVVFTLDLQGNFTSVNPAGEQLSGYTREEALALNLADVVVPEQIALAREMIRRKVLGEVESTRYPLAIRAKDGRRVELEVSTCLVAGDGGPAEIQGIARDITERTRADAAQRLLVRASGVLAGSLDYEAALQAVAQLAVAEFADWCAVDLLDEDGTIRRLVVEAAEPSQIPLARALLGYPPDLDRSHGVARVLRTGQPELLANISEYHLARWARDAEHLRIIRQLGTRTVLTVPLVARGRMLGTISLAAAQPGRYGEAEVALAEDLASRVALAIDNARLYSQAQRALRARDEFLSAAAHELRTPLATILAHVELLTQPAGAPSDADVRNALAAIERQGTRLRRLVGELLEVSRLELGRLELYRRRLELGEVADGVLRELQATSPRYRLVLERAGPAWVEADGYRIEQVLLNLLSNAVKFSPVDGEIVVQVGTRAGEAVVSVRDQGIGIAPERQGRLFERFYRGHAGTERDREGMGLGLYISREFVERHGGRIWCESALGRGSAFAFSLPLAEDADGATRV